MSENFERNNFRTNFTVDIISACWLYNHLFMRYIQRWRYRRTIIIVVSFFLKRQEGSTFFTGVFVYAFKVLIINEMCKFFGHFILFFWYFFRPYLEEIQKERPGTKAQRMQGKTQMLPWVYLRHANGRSNEKTLSQFSGDAFHISRLPEVSRLQDWRSANGRNSPIPFQVRFAQRYGQSFRERSFCTEPQARIWLSDSRYRHLWQVIAEVTARLPWATQAGDGQGIGPQKGIWQVPFQ